MKRIKIILILACVSLTAFAAALICACSIGEPQLNTEGLDAYVTYYSNGGSFNSGNTIKYQTLRFKDGAPVLDLGSDQVNNITFEMKKTNSEFVGWAYAELDENGKPVLTDAEGNKLEVKDSGSPYIEDANGKELDEQIKDFTAELKTDSNGDPELAFENQRPTASKETHLYLAAYWVPSVKIDYVLVSDDGDITFNPTEGEEKLTFKDGDVFASTDFGTFTNRQLTPAVMPLAGYRAEGYSFINLYLDEECTNPVPDGYSVSKPEAADAENIRIYARFKKGSWTAVRNASDVQNMLGSTVLVGNYVLVNDIQMTASTSIERNSLMSTPSSIVFEGEGHKITGLNIKSNPTPGQTISLFGKIGAGASIKNVMFEDVTITITVLRGNASFYMLFESLAEGATLDNLQVNKVNAMVTLGKQVGGNYLLYNLQNGNTSHWLYGGGDSDEQFVAVNGEIVKEAQIQITQNQ